VCAYPPQGNAPQANHWVVFLELGHADSVKVDMTPGSDNSTGVAMLTYKRYTTSRTALVDRVYETRNNPTVQTMLDLVTQNRLDKYRFNADGEGCRYWIYRFIQTLEGAGYLDPGTAADVWSHLSYFWRSSTDREAKVVAQGTFYWLFVLLVALALEDDCFSLRSFLENLLSVGADD
jgi:hypothetical protein